MNLAPNDAAVFAYLLGWLSGLIVYVLEDRNEFVRFHAVQSMLFGVVVTGLYLVVVAVDPRLSVFVWLGGLAVWVLLLFKAYNWQWFALPVLGDVAYDQVRRPRPPDAKAGRGTRPDDRRRPPGNRRRPPDRDSDRRPRNR